VLDYEDDFSVDFYNRLCERIERLDHIYINNVEMEIFYVIRELELRGDFTTEEASGIFEFICFHLERRWIV
jgi:hypothetical protein